MAFPVKDWQDNISDWDAAAAEDMETRLSGYTDSQLAVVKEAGLNPEDYGARGDGASPAEDTAGFAEAVGQLPTVDGFKTGRIWMPPNRRYKINAGGGLDLTDAEGLELVGVGGMSERAGRPMIEWLGGAGSGSLINAPSSTINVRDLALTYSNAAYDGELVKLGHSARIPAVDPFYPEFSRVYFAGISGAVGARSLLNVDRGLGGKVKGCQFIDAITGLRGFDGTYANGWKITDECFFDRLSLAGIYNPGEAWTIDGNIFGHKADGSPCPIRCDSFDGGNYVPIATNIFGNWFGDITDVLAAVGGWIQMRGRGVNVIGNRIHVETAGVAHVAITFRNVHGGQIAGNRFLGGNATVVGIDFQQHSGALCDGIEVRTNHFTAINQVTNEANLTSGEYRNNVGLADKKIGRPAALPSFTVATLPAAASFTGGMVYVSDGAGGAKLRYSDGSTWVSAG